MKKDLKDKKTIAEKLDCKRGFTLLEVLLAVTIFSLVLAALFTFYWGALQGWARGTAAMDLQQNARIAIYEITRELRYALILESFNDENVLPLYDSEGDTQQQGAGKLVYTSSEGKRCEIVFNEYKRTVTLSIEGGPPNELAYNVTGLDFFRYIPQGTPGGGGPGGASPMILMTLKVQEGDKGVAPGVSYFLQSTVRLQNIEK